MFLHIMLFYRFALLCDFYHFCSSKYENKAEERFANTFQYDAVPYTTCTKYSFKTQQSRQQLVAVFKAELLYCIALHHTGVYFSSSLSSILLDNVSIQLNSLSALLCSVLSHTHWHMTASLIHLPDPHLTHDVYVLTKAMRYNLRDHHLQGIMGINRKNK